MVDIEDISKIFNQVTSISEVDKCGRSSYAKTRGTKVTTSTEFRHGDDYIVLTYENGISISIHSESLDIVSFTNEEGVTMDYMFDKDYEFFEEQKDALIDKFGYEEYRFFREYVDMYATWRGFRLNAYLRGLISKDELKDAFDYSWDSAEYDLIVGQHDRFLKILDSLELPEGDYFSVRVADHLHDNDSVDKGITWDKGHTCTTTGADMEDLFVFADVSSVDSCWKIITDYSGQRNVKGAFFGNALADARSSDWEHEVHHAPGQKFERVLIDEENKIIVQKPYNG